MTRDDQVVTAFVLAAGMGNRMRPLTDTLPKPLVALAGRPLIDHVLDRIAAAGISRAVVNVHYMADKLEAHLKGWSNPKVIFSDERDALLDTGGGVVRALPLIGRGAVLIHNSDSVWIEGHEPNLGRLLAAYDPVRMDSLLLLAPRETSLGYDGLGDFSLGPDGRLERRIGQQPAPYVFAGVSMIHTHMFNGEAERPFSLNHVWDRGIAARRLYGIVLEGKWMHVGTPEALADAERAIAGARTTSPAMPGPRA